MYTTPDSSASALPTFLGNHDMGRIGYLLQTTGDAQRRDELAHDLMYLTRGQPVVYYGDEQGFAGWATARTRTRVSRCSRPRSTSTPTSSSSRARPRAARTATTPRRRSTPTSPSSPRCAPTTRRSRRAPRSSVTRTRARASTRSRASTAPRRSSTSWGSTTRAHPRPSASRPSPGRDLRAALRWRRRGHGRRRRHGVAHGPGARRRRPAGRPHRGRRVHGRPHRGRPGRGRRPHGRQPGQRRRRRRRVVRDQLRLARRRVGRVAGLGTAEDTSPRVFHDVSDLATGTLVEYRAVTVDADGDRAAASTFASVGNGVSGDEVVEPRRTSTS
ncbi:alpha-amylase family glycosyl hydrolase [Oerskovia sp. M15]